MSRVERVVYILGAGFSAPLGIPVMADFMRTARDLSEMTEYQDKYKQFQDLLDEVEGLRVAAARIGVDPDNIEDVLSVFAMSDEFAGTQAMEKYASFVAHVVRDSTPSIRRGAIHPHFQKHPHRANVPDTWQGHAAFRFALEWVDLPIYPSPEPILRPSADVEYAVITLNYDMVLESAWECLPATSGPIAPTLKIAKLHGSAGDFSVIPPTWNKALRRPDVQAAWKLAFDVLTLAHQIRVLGYSFPATDPYMRYLFAAALRQNKVLKHFDMICRDSNGEVKSRFDRIVSFSRRRFVSGELQRYLDNYMKGYISQRDGRFLYHGVEDMHEAFMRNNGA